MEEILKVLINDNDYIVICHNDIKQKLVKKLSKELKSIKIKSFSEVKEEVFGKVDNKVILQNMNEDINIEVLKIKLDNSCLISKDDDDYLIHELYDYKVRNNLFPNKLIIDYYKNKKIYLINYYDNDDLMNIFLKAIGNHSIYLYNNKINNEALDIYEFADYETEIVAIANKISMLLTNGVDPSKIIINKVDSDYELKFKEIMSFYHLDYDFNENIPLIDYEYTKTVISDILKEKEGKFNDFIKDYIKDKTNPLLTEIINALNVLSYFDYDMSNILLEDIITYILSNTYYTKTTYKNMIKFEKIFDNIYDSDTYLFILNFTQDVVPNTFKDNLYLQDNKRRKYGLIETIERNRKEREKVIDFILHYPKINISYANNSLSGKNTKSNLITLLKDKTNVREMKKEVLLNEVTSREYAFLRFLKAKELFAKYNEKSLDFICGYTTFNGEDRKYDSTFKGIDASVLESFTNDLHLSYSSLSDFFSCPFHYYTKNILKIIKKGETMENNNSLFIGSLYHHVLEHLIKDKYLSNKEILDIDKEINNHVDSFLKEKNISLPIKTEFYLRKLLIEMKKTFEEITIFTDNSDFKVWALEQNFSFEIDENTKLVGFIDKILKYKNYYVVIDYKTNDVEVDWRSLDHGLQMQLPIYLCLIKRMDKDALFAGAYLESILQNNQFKYQGNKSYEEMFVSSRKYQGYTVSNSEIIKALDHNFSNSNGSLPLSPFKKSGDLSENFIKKAFSEEEFSKIIKFTEKKIEEALNKIKKGEFDIKPFKVNTFYSCAFCEHKDICFKNISMEKEYFKNKDFSFLFLEEGGKNEVE